MHASSERNIRKFVASTRPQWPLPACADLGSLHISGGVRDVVHCAVTGFDIVAGPGVDVVLDPHEFVPLDYCGQFGAVIAASSFQFCPEPTRFVSEAWELCAPGGFVYVGMCGSGCSQQHNTSVNPYDWGDELRLTLPEFAAMWSEHFIPLHYWQLRSGHRDLIYWGRKA